MPTVKTSTQPYPPGTQWKITSPYGHAQTEELVLIGELNGSSLTDAYLFTDISAEDLWQKWVDEYANYAHEKWPTHYQPGDVTISWFVTTPRVRGILEAAPYEVQPPRNPALEEFFGDVPYEPQHFLAHYHPPVNAQTGEPLNWLRLPVLDRAWNETAGDKGGFIQELTGWKPSPLQPTVNVLQLGRAAGLYVPTLT